MERFVRFIVGGGVALVAGLWIVTLLEARSVWLLGGVLVLFGVAGLAGGIWMEVDY